MSLLKTTIKKKLAAGKTPMRIVTYKEVANDMGGYIEVHLALPDRNIQQNFFPSNIKYLGTSLRQQLNLADEDMELSEILEQAKGKDIFGVISYNEYGLNIALHEKTEPKNLPEITEEDFQ